MPAFVASLLRSPALVTVSLVARLKLQCQSPSLLATVSLTFTRNVLQLLTSFIDFLAELTNTTLLSVPGCHWSVYCNNCDQALPSEHWHCDTCDQGDYDLCNACHDDGKHCKSSDHFMVKRWIENGKVTTSRTERVAPKPKTITPAVTLGKAPTVKREPTIASMPGAFAEEKKSDPDPEVVASPTRTCNCCVKVFPEQHFVTCLACEDYDLCLDCHCENKHGHHPGHAFKPAVDGTPVRPLADFLLAAGRNVRHAALCDGCDRHIYGVRHKCLNCPDWDFCSECVKSAPKTHAGHRFAPIYEPLADVATSRNRHIGIFCDGPLCKDTPAGHQYIQGIRYKCAICDDMDFCANCEAAPRNKHNRTHPLIKFKTPVRSVSVTTMGEDGQGQTMPHLGDLPSRPMPAANSLSPMQPIIDVKPSLAAVPKPVEKIEIKDLLAEPITEKIKVRDLLSPGVPAQVPAKTAVNASTMDLNAHFVQDTITDGTGMLPNQRFVQTWTLRNPGPHAWPAGCSVRYVGGDNMLCVKDSSSPDIESAFTSNVIDRTVQEGERIAFHVVMQAPTREGTSISYWRLKTMEGVPFGHRLWCHINVSKAVTDMPPPPSNMAESPSITSIPSPDPGMIRIFREMSEKRRAMSEAVKQTEMRVKQLQEAQKQREGLIEEQERLKRIQMLRALHAARLAAVSAEKKDLAASMKPVTRPKIEEVSEIPIIPQIPVPTSRAPPAPTVEDVPEKDDERVAAAVPHVEAKMVFPKLEKESPASSIHDASAASMHTTATAAETIKTETASEAPLSPAHTDATGFFEEDAQTIRSFDEDDSEDDGFLTDEEYDILDASDEEEHA